MTRAAAASSEVFEIIDAPVTNQTGFTPPDSSAFQGALRFKKVEFSYPSRPNSLILNQLNVTFESGQVTAIVGPSGSGKSTIVGLIERWYEPSSPADVLSVSTDMEYKQEFDIFKNSEARFSSSITSNSGIYISDLNVQNINVKWLRSKIGLVQQEPFLFNDTIFQNVANGLSGTRWEHANHTVKLTMVEDACRQAFADEFISKLPEGLETSVGEGGMKLSGGQRQRLAIARAIVKQPLILILDEATSAIDVRSERIVQRALDRASKGRTTIVIAHRLSTIKKANKIVVVKDGTVVEEGTHDQLLQHGGVYGRLVKAQEVLVPERGSSDRNSVEEENNSAFSQSEEILDGSGPPSVSQEKETEYKEKGFVRSLGFLVLDSRSKRFLLLLTLFGAMGGGGK
jgi:ATP-binding cassette subfamily B (MDR/TAP) protein 1